MFLLVGIAVVLVSVFGGYALNDGHLPVLWQPVDYRRGLLF